MSREYIYTNLNECWNQLAIVLSYGHTLQFAHTYQGREQKFTLINQKDSRWHHDDSCAEYLLDDIHHALFEEGLETIILCCDGREHGPICDSWRFFFNKSGLFKATNYWDAD